MAKIPKRYRRRKGTKRLDITDLKHVLKDRRCWACMAVVVAPDDSPHFEIVAAGGGLVEVLIEVETQPEEIQMTCRLGAPAGGANRGVWAIPPIGSEVAVLVPRGKIDWQPMIVAVLSTGQVPTDLAENVTVIANSEVLIHDGDGGAAPLATKADVDTIRGELDGHAHTYLPGGGVATTTTLNPSVTAPAGTQILKAK